MWAYFPERLMSFINTPSLASASSTRVDSACKHIQQCRVSYDHMLDFVGSANELERNKMQYCVHKDELAVGVARPWVKSEVRTLPTSAYPRIVSNLGNIASGGNPDYEWCMKMIKYLYHFSTSLERRQEIIDQMNNRPNNNIPITANITPYFQNDQNINIDLHKYMKKLYDFYPVGFANTLGYAHPSSGDTMSSVMIGGLRTVMNGDFEVFAGDTIQWYWTFEYDCFHADGKRKGIVTAGGVLVENGDPAVDHGAAPAAAPLPGAPGGLPNADPRGRHRRIHNDFQYGISPDNYSPANKAKNVARIKPYMPDDEQPRLYDWVRVFAIAISSARPNEMVDIKISRQSM
jgi:hypothetical protein